MIRSARVWLLVAAGALAVGWLWLRSSSSEIREPSEAVTKVPEVSVTPTTAVFAPAAVLEDSAASKPLDAPETEDALLDKIEHKLADALYPKVGASLVDELTAKGLSPKDSARMVREGVSEWARCHLDTMLAQAAAQQMPRRSVLDTVDATLVPPPGTDASALLQRLNPCVEGVRQRMGLPAHAPPERRSAQ